MDYFVTFIFVTIITAFFTWLTVYLTQKFRRKSEKVLTGIDILQVLRHLKLFPIGPCMNWRLCNFMEDRRVWVSEIHSSILPRPLTVHACVAKVKGSSQSVLGCLKNAMKYSQWTPGVYKVKHIVAASEPETPPKISGGVIPVYHDVISVVMDMTMTSSMMGFVNKVSQYVQGVPLVHAVKEIHRYWCKEENNCCWLLEMNENTEEWAFYLAQPTEGFFEIDQCLLSLVTCSSPELDLSDNASHIPARQLAAFCNYFAFRKVQCAPLLTVSLPVSDDILKVDLEVNKAKTDDVLPTGSSELSKSEPNFIKKFKTMIEEKKEWYEERKRKSAPGVLNKHPKADQASSILQQHPSGYLLRELDMTDTDEVDSTVEDLTRDSNESLSDQKLIPMQGGSGSKIERKSILKILRSQSLIVNGSEGNFKDELGKASSDKSITSDKENSKGSTEKLPGTKAGKEAPAVVTAKETFASRFMRRVKSLDVPKDSTVGSDNPHHQKAVTEASEDDESLLADEDVIDEMEYRTIAESVAVDLLAEKARISHLDISRPFEQQAAQTGGWVYCGLEKDVVILRKIYNSGTPYQCYLGKGLIPVPPKVVFEAIKNPQTRFTYDEMLKKVEILHDFENGMRIIYLYHEVSQLFRKEARDFCVLQTEQIEGVKYIISIRSVTYPGCPETEDTIRGRFLPSGWIIEPVTKNQKLYSMVTYIVQMELEISKKFDLLMELGMSKTNTGYLIAELAAKQPLSIVHLRQLLAPSSSSSKGTTPSSVRRRSLGGNTLAVAAAGGSQNARRNTTSDCEKTVSQAASEEFLNVELPDTGSDNLDESNLDELKKTSSQGDIVTKHEDGSEKQPEIKPIKGPESEAKLGKSVGAPGPKEVKVPHSESEAILGQKVQTTRPGEVNV